MIILSVLTSVAGRVVSNVASLATDQLRLEIVLGFHKEVNTLKESSTQIGDILHDAAHEPEDRKLRARTGWMKSLIRVAYDAEDVLDELQYEVHRIVVKGTSPDPNQTILGFFCHNPLVFRLKMARMIYNINTSLENLTNQAARVGLVMTSRSNGGAVANQGMLDRETTSFPEKNDFTFKDAIIVGRDKVMSNIIATLSNSNHQELILSVMAVVGMPGIGKTTLARSVTKQLKEGELAKHFDTTLWVYVSNTFDVNSILSRLVESCEATRSNLLSREALIASLRRKLSKKKVFLVLDDVWNEEKEKWDLLRSCLLQLNFARGSTVFVTTRSVKVASIMEALPCWDLEALSDDECWSILKDRAFADPNALMASDLERIGRDIAKKCAGLPLAAKILGSLMRSKNSSNEWPSILESEIWQLSADNEDSRMMSILMLSFDNLKSPLKQCFSYCSMLKRGSLIEKDNLIQLWMAQGFLHPSNDDKSKEEIGMEDIGKKYFDSLLENSLFQDATEDENGVITKCKMHDLVHDLANELSKCESLTPDFNHVMDTLDLRHVARVPSPVLEERVKISISRLRSLILNVPVSNTIFRRLKALRLLSFENAMVQNLPNSLGKMKHLRYLDLSSTEIKDLPKSIGKLYNLQTLRLPILEKCPKEIQNLINLRHLYFDREMEFEAGVLGRLTELRTLRYFKVGEEMGPTIQELGGLEQLRGHLIISKLEHVRDGEEAKKAFLATKSHLSELTFQWTHQSPANDNDTDILDGLKPHGNLQCLKIENFMGGRFPSWRMSLQNMKKIRLVGCHNCEEVPTLGQLPNLTSLKIKGMKKLRQVGVEFYGNSSVLFPALKLLHIADCKRLTEWMEAPRISAEEEVTMVFPCLEKLKLSQCRRLRNAPSRFPCLKKLCIYTMDNYMPIENISTELTTLASLYIRNVKRLTCLPEGMLKSLTYVEIRSCSELTSIAPDVSGGCTSLQSLIVFNCEKLTDLPDKFGLHTLPRLEELKIDNCPRLESIRITQGIASLRHLKIFGCQVLSRLEVGLCTSLQEMRIRDCPNLMSIPSAQGMPSLRKLHIEACDGLGSGLNYCTSLQQLEINDCHNLTSVPIARGITSLRKLRIFSCGRLLSLPSGLLYCTSLQHLEITNCRSLVSISASYVCDHPESKSQPQEIFPTLVGYLSLPEDCRSLQSIPPNLRHLLICTLEDCGKLKYVPTGFQRLTLLKNLIIGPFWEELDAFPDFQLPPQLEELHLEGWPKLNSLPQQIEQCTCLKALSITIFMGLNVVPEWLGNLTSLESLTIVGCENLEYLPTEKAMTSLTKLKKLSIWGCPLLKQRCTKETGPEWPKISHIPELDL